MPKCSDCGFNEEERSDGINPLTNKQEAFPVVHAICTYDLKNPKRIPDPFAERECRNFAQKRKGWLTKEFHEWKDRHITTRRNFLISVIALAISLLTLIFGVIVPSMTRVPEVELTFQLLPRSISAPINMTIPISFSLYNSGYKDCFIASASLYEVFENQSKQVILGIFDLWGTRLGSGETRQVQFDLSYPSEGTIITQFQIEVYYEPNRYAISQPIWVKWH